MKQENRFLIKKAEVLIPLSLFFIAALLTSLLVIALLAANHSPRNLPVDIKSQIHGFSFISILIQNIGVAMLLMSGFFFHKISTIIVLIANAVNLSFILTTNIYTTGALGYFLGITSIHGVIELSALILAANIGFHKINLKKKEQRHALANTVLLILALLTVAASLEAFVTPIFWR